MSSAGVHLANPSMGAVRKHRIPEPLTRGPNFICDVPRPLTGGYAYSESLVACARRIWSCGCWSCLRHHLLFANSSLLTPSGARLLNTLVAQPE